LKPPVAPTNPAAQLARGTVDVSVYAAEDPVKVALRRHIPDLLNSFKIAAGATLLLLAAAFGPARALSRARRSPFAQRALVLLPLAFPGLMVGMGIEQLFVNAPDRVYRGWGIVSLALASRYLPLAVLTLRASWVRIAPEIEESAALADVGAVRRFGRITLPLLLPGALAAGVLCFTLSLREFDSIVLLFGAQEMLFYAEPCRHPKIRAFHQAAVLRWCGLVSGAPEMARALLPGQGVWLQSDAGRAAVFGFLVKLGEEL